MGSRGIEKRESAKSETCLGHYCRPVFLYGGLAALVGALSSNAGLPQHLFQTQVLRAYNDTAFDYSQNFEIHLKPAYASFYLITLFFPGFCRLKIAGKLSLSIYLFTGCGYCGATWSPPGGMLLLGAPCSSFRSRSTSSTSWATSTIFWRCQILILTLLDMRFLLVFWARGPSSGIPSGKWHCSLHTHSLSACMSSWRWFRPFLVRRRTPQFKVKVLASLSVAILLFWHPGS